MFIVVFVSLIFCCLSASRWSRIAKASRSTTTQPTGYLAILKFVVCSPLRFMFLLLCELSRTRPTISG